jgi:hypothetical protein
MLAIKQQLERTIDSMEGEWVSTKNGYEKTLSKTVGWENREGRYADGTNGTTDIEYKKGQGAMWYDMVRYAEIEAGIGTQDTATCMFHYTKCEKYGKHVRDIHIMDTKKLSEYMLVNRKIPQHLQTVGDFCMWLNDSLPHGLNMQACASNTDHIEMASYTITSRKERERGMMEAEDNASRKWNRPRANRKKRERYMIIQYGPEQKKEAIQRYMAKRQRRVYKR